LKREFPTDCKFVYGNSWSRLLGQALLALLAFGLAGAAFVAAWASDIRLILVCIPLTPPVTNILFALTGLLMAGVGLLIGNQAFREARQRRRIAFTSTSIVQLDAKRRAHRIPFTKIQKITLEGFDDSAGVKFPALDPSRHLHLSVVAAGVTFRVWKGKLPQRGAFDEVVRRFGEQGLMSPITGVNCEQHERAPAAAYDVVAVPLDAQPCEQEVTTLPEEAKAKEYARFLAKGGRFRNIEVRVRSVGIDAPVESRNESDLGDVVFKRYYNPAHRVLAWLYFLPVTLGCAAAARKYVADGIQDSSRHELLWGILWAAIALLGGLGMWQFLRTSFRIHERGISRRTIFHTRRLCYQDLYTIAVSPYTVTTLLAGLVPISRRGISEIRFVPRPGLGLDTLIFWGPDGVIGNVKRAVRKHADIRLESLFERTG
jgi:hypothetical protein